MGWDGSGAFITAVLVLAGVAVALIYGYMEYQVRMLQTTATRLATGLLFTSRFLTVDTRNATQEVRINAPMGWQSTPQSLADLMRVPAQELAVVLPAIGLQCVIQDTPTHRAGETSDRCIVVFTACDAAKLEALGLPAQPATLVVIEGVPLPVALSFKSFAAQMDLWIERVEYRIQLQRAAEQRKAEEDAAAAAAAVQAALARAVAKSSQPKEDMSKPVSEEERKFRTDQQIAAWRSAAGFRGTSSEISVDLRGKVQWFIELEPAGRVIVHSNGRTFHGSLKGAKITTLTGELELGVRDALWSEDEPALSHFNIMAGAKAETRLAWKERMEILIRSLR